MNKIAKYLLITSILGGSIGGISHIVGTYSYNKKYSQKKK